MSNVPVSKNLEINVTRLVAMPVIDYPHEFPAYHRLSKAWRHHKLGWRMKWNELKNLTFYVFVMDEEYGVCKLTRIPARHLRKRRSGFVLSFQTNYEPTRVVLYAALEESADMFDKLHASLKTSMQYSIWQPEAGTNSGELSALCSDTFEKEINTDA